MSRTDPVPHDRGVVVSERVRARRVVEAVGFVAAWVGLGYLLPVSSEAYLLMGIPLTIAFQVLVRRRPVRELLVRGGGTGSVRASGSSRRDVAVTALLVLAPLSWGLQATGGGDPWVIGWYAAAVVGAAAAAYALRSTSVRAVLRSAALPTAVGVVGNVLVVGGVQLATGTSIGLVAMLGSVLKWLAIYFPATFVIEEVAFRGALDAHVHHPGDGRGWGSALLVSALWGLWHLPVADGMPFPLLVLSLVTWHCVVGVPLSFAWRRTGNLSGPAFAHSAIDAVRNGLIGL
jgi:membrane protease YdiL (CAAX protease family)